jgi:DNA mismatch endonuclease (patch repair protein)
MKANRSRNTGPELRLRSAVHELGLRYRVAFRPVAGVVWTADMVFRRAMVVVFLDGCFWHGCELHFKPPATNPDYWRRKMARNRERDTRVNALLEQAGWRVLRVWEHEDLPAVARRIRRIVLARDRRSRQPQKASQRLAKIAFKRSTHS